MTNEIQTQDNTLPAYMQDAEYNASDIDIKEIKIPWIMVGQLTSGPVKEGTVKYGEIYSTTGENFGKDLDIIVIKPFINWVRFDKGEGMVGRSSNGHTWEEGKLAGTPLSKDRDNDETFKCKRYNFYVIKAGQRDAVPYVLSMYSSSGGKTGSDLYNKIALNMVKLNKPCYVRKYTLTTVADKNDIGDFNSWKVKDSGFASEEDFKLASEARKFIDANRDLIKHDDDISIPATPSQDITIEKTEGDF